MLISYLSITHKYNDEHNKTNKIKTVFFILSQESSGRGFRKGNNYYAAIIPDLSPCMRRELYLPDKFKKNLKINEFFL